MTGRTATIFFVILMSVTGCSTVFSSEFPHVWVASGTASAFMVQITRQTSNLSGTADWASIEGSDPTKVVPTHAAFTGTIDGAAITLTFPSGFGFVTNM